jgi:hypothetical protein
VSSEVKKKKRETVGSISARLAEKAPDAQNAIDQMREQLTDYDHNIHECVKEHRKVFDGDFYVVVITKKERLMQNVFRGYFTARLSCPTPDYDQAVYKYIRADDDLKFLWVIPSADTVNLMKNNVHHVPSEQYALLGFVLKFIDGSLLRMAKEMNGEKADSNIVEKR